MQLITVDHKITKPVEGKKVFNENNREIMHVKLRTGEVVDEHDSPKHVFIFVKSGEVEFTIGNESCTINEETILHMDPYERHALKALSDVAILVMKC